MYADQRSTDLCVLLFSCFGSPIPVLYDLEQDGLPMSGLFARFALESRFETFARVTRR